MKPSNRTLIKMLVMLVVLNIIDAIATIYFVSNGLAKELNPFMAIWLEVGNMPFLFIKLLFVFLGVSFLWKVKKNKLVYLLTIPLLALYIVVMLIHVSLFVKIYG